MLDEPLVLYPEAAFEAALASIVRACCATSEFVVVVPHFGLDIAVLGSLANGLRTVFIEAKSYGGQRAGGVGFGNGRGEGAQVDLLLCDEGRLDILDECVRWAFADATKPAASSRYALLNCTQARASTMGGVARDKQNNFRMTAVAPHFLPWPAFCDRLAAFILDSKVPAV